MIEAGWINYKDHKGEKGDDVFVFTVNSYSQIVLRETRIVVIKEATVVERLSQVSYEYHKEENDCLPVVALQ